MCISKIIANRVKEGLGDIVSINQSAFVPDLDIQKACDIVDWRFLETILVGFGFHPKMVQWIMVCVTGPSYFIRVNGNLHGWVKGKRGLWQDDPLSPYLFTLVMEILTLILQRRVRDSDDFYSVVVIMDALEEFKQVSGLVPSITKSMAFFCNVPNAIKASILNSMPFAEGFCFRVNDWRNKFLSLAGRLRLIRSVLSSMHIYWASIFILPNRIVHDLEQLMRGFLWCQGEMKKGKSKFTWNSVCMPKHEGGLGRSFWDVPCRGDVSWEWHKLLQIRSTIRPFIWHNINNGKSTSAWFDRWVDLCPLKDMFSNKDIARSGFSLDDSVPLLLDDIDDVILLRDRDGVLRPFSVACAWDTIRTRADIVNWYNVILIITCSLSVLSLRKCGLRLVFSTKGILFHLGLLMLLLSLILYPREKWRLVFFLDLCLLLHHTTFDWKGMEDYSRRRPRLRIRLLMLCSYCVAAGLWLKLVTFKFKKMSTRSRLLLDQWKIPRYYIIYDGSSRSRVTLVIGDGTRSIHATISTPGVEIFKPFKALELKKTKEGLRCVIAYQIPLRYFDKVGCMLCICWFHCSPLQVDRPPLNFLFVASSPLNSLKSREIG
ncbi:putative gag-pol polyprotein [Tanacetum coccineum]